MNRFPAASLFVIASLFISSGCAAFAATPCEDIKTLAFTNTTITVSEMVAAGPYKVPGPPGAPAAELALPAHCRIAAVLSPSSDSEIHMELWLPATDWNNRFEGVGNGGWAGNVTFGGMAQALKEGYATASTDTGHTGGDGAFASGHMEKVIDYSYRAVHEMTLKSKQMIEAFYGRAARFAYWNGCSYGGRQGLEEAQRYPDDYDGILAGAPANYHLHLHAFDMNVAKTNLQDAAHMVPKEKLALLNHAVLAACDALDGVKDGILTDPHKCHFDPESLLCKTREPNVDPTDCLTAEQLETVKVMYAPAKTKSGNIVYPGLPLGGELGWTRLYTPEPMAVPLGSFKYVLYQDANWDWKKFDLDRDVAAVDEKAGSTLNAINPDLTAFEKHGGKLLMYHGWNDQLITAQNSINYYQSVLSKMGANQSNWYRLFMMPGMMHCRGGPGPDQFSMMGIMERWRENNTPPDQITAMHVAQNRVDMTRPLCPYPQVAVYKGSGNPNDAGNFACRAQ